MVGLGLSGLLYSILIDAGSGEVTWDAQELETDDSLGHSTAGSKG